MARAIRPFTQEEKETIIKLYKEGYTPGEICKKCESLKDRKSQVLYPILIKRSLLMTEEDLKLMITFLIKLTMNEKHIG